MQITPETKTALSKITPWVGFAALFFTIRTCTAPSPVNISTPSPVAAQEHIETEEETDLSRSLDESGENIERLREMIAENERKEQERLRVIETSEDREKANTVLKAYIRHINAYSWHLSKLPRDELNEMCWLNRVAVQELQERFDGGQSIDPSQLRPFDEIFFKDMTCRMAAHYRETGSSPEFGTADLSTLEGMSYEHSSEAN